MENREEKGWVGVSTVHNRKTRRKTAKKLGLSWAKFKAIEKNKSQST